MVPVISQRQDWTEFTKADPINFEGYPNHMHRSVRKQIEKEGRKCENDIKSDFMDDMWRNDCEKFHARMQDRSQLYDVNKIDTAIEKLRKANQNTK